MQKRKKLDLGKSDFKSIIENDNYFVDKSLFIKEVIKAEKSVILLPRPRRFGKTLNLSMLRAFFDIREPENQNLFTDLKIWQSGDDIKAHQGKYPVIYLTLKDAKKNNWSDTLRHIKTEITKLYRHHRYLLKNDTLYEDEKQQFNRVLLQTGDIVDFEDSLKYISEFLHRYYNQNVVILIDEYDAPIQAGYRKFYKEVIGFMRNLLSGALKDNTYLHKGIITGILRVSRESIFSGLNNLTVHSILESRFSDNFGFTKDEVKQILVDFEVPTDFAEIQKWYDGYNFGNTPNIYNPWSILNYVVEYQDGFRTYWANTSSDDLIKQEIRKKDAETIRTDIMKLISGEAIEKDIEPNFVFPDLEFDNELLWTLLLFSGYLTIKDKISRKEYSLVIPNAEVRTVYQDIILKWIKIDLKIHATLLKETISNLVSNEINQFEHGFRKIMGDTFSYFDTGKEPEYAYQSYVLGLLAIIGDDYIIKSNRESGEGRYDVMLIPHDKTKYGIVIEIKTLPKDADAETINAKIVEAQKQIEKNEYYKELIENKITPENIIKLPIVFAGKEPYINQLKITN